MSFSIRAIAIAIALPLFLGAALAEPAVTHGKGPHWEIKGGLSEACTCSVPCGCNFGSHASHHFCWSVASFGIEKGHYGSVKLDGLHLVRAHGKEATVWYVDDQASASQAAALQSIATALSGSVGRRASDLHFEKASITQVVGKSGSQVKVGDHGGFKAAYIIGMDGKNPIVVENMTAWNVQHDIKGKTDWLRYQDRFGNQFSFNGTNANQGRFDWTDRTPRYF
ncbi:MAG TPA: DUF1326 domain-containing protein [Terriglobia bacterium]|nr:DUF1326 domain-containing protein [Terriglobia bacterium]